MPRDASPRPPSPVVFAIVATLALTSTLVSVLNPAPPAPRLAQRAAAPPVYAVR